MSSVSPPSLDENRRTHVRGYRYLKRKGRLFSVTPFLIVCPADAVLAKLPFPSKQGWITVGALLTSNQGLSLNRAQPSLHGI
jgi:hypothetical protein